MIVLKREEIGTWIPFSRVGHHSLKREGALARAPFPLSLFTQKSSIKTCFLLLLLLKPITVGYRYYNFLIPTLYKLKRVQLASYKLVFDRQSCQFREDIPFCFKNTSFSKLLSNKFERFGT